MANIKRWLGIDGVDLAIHLTVTGMAAGLFSELAGPGRGEDVAVFAVFLVSTLVLAWRRSRGLRQAGSAPPERVAELEGRVAELEDLLATGGGSLHGRMMELEERLDFAERMLSRQREAERLPGT
jgi:membrane protein implicated in regulation of membrane protease activity